MLFTRAVTRTMEFKFDGYHRDGTMCVYGYEGKQKVSVALIKQAITIFKENAYLEKKIGGIYERYQIDRNASHRWGAD